MNIGFVTQALPYLPSAGGFRLCAANLIRCLSRHHCVHLISLLRDDDAEHVEWARQYCKSVITVPLPPRGIMTRAANVISGYCRGQLVVGRMQLIKEVQQSALSNQWDVMHVEGSAIGSMVSDCVHLPKILSIHDSGTLRCLEMLRCCRSLSDQLYFGWLRRFERRFERLVFPRYDAVTVVAQRDLEEVERLVPDSCVRWISNGIDTEYFYPLKTEKRPATLVFHSHLGYAPNVQAALEFADRIFPKVRRKIPKAVFHLVGANPVKEIAELASRPGIEVSANVPDIRPEVCSAQVYVCPIRYGTGMKNKMLEAMAMQMPIVAYPGSIVGLGCVHRKHVMEAKTADEFACYIIDLLEDSQRSEQLATEARHFVREHFSWWSQADAYEDLYREIMSRKHRVAVGVIGKEAE